MQETNSAETSEFRSEVLANDGEIDFSQALKLHGEGSICEAFVVRHHRRRVFMKRLKEEYMNSSLHLAALDKEFDIGVTLNHKSLPRYIEFHDNYILMDFIEGDSLHKMIVNHDPWLNSRQNLWRFLRQLLEVTDYLHNRHIVHCDIKPDNILLTWEERNVVLIDLDKCFTDWLDDTRGKPRFNIGDDSKAGVKNDFEAVGFIVDLWIESAPSLKNMSVIKFRNLCFKKNVRIEELNAFIDKQLSKTRGRYYGLLSAVAVMLILCGAAGIILFQNAIPKKGEDEITKRMAAETPERIIADTVVIVSQEPDEIKIIPSETLTSKGKSVSHTLASLAEKSFSRNIEATLIELTRFKELSKDSTLTRNSLFSFTPGLLQMYNKAFKDTRSELMEAFPDVTTQKIDDAIILSKSFQNYMEVWKETLEIFNKREVSKVVSDSLKN